MGEPTVLLVAEPPQELPPREKWILHTDDTRLAVGVSSDQKLCIYELSGPDGWNWTKVPSVFPLLDRVNVVGALVTPAWTYSQGSVDKSDGVKLISSKPKARPFTVSAELAWAPSKNARSYRVSVSDTREFTNPVAMESAATSPMTISPLPPARKLYWKVEEVSAGGTRANTGGPGTFTTPDNPAKGVSFASDMQWAKATAGAGNTVHRDTNLNGQPLAINGKSYLKGLWTHAFNDQTPSDIVFDISGREYSTFKATVGLDDLGEHGSVQFQVLVDGVKKAESPVMLPKKTHELSVNLNQGKEVTLRVLNGGDGYAWDHAVWCFARFIEAGIKDPFENAR